MQNTNGRGLKFVVLLMIGILFSGIVTIMYLTKSINLERFYDVGNLHDVYEQYYRSSGEQWIYDYSAEVTRTEGENARCSFPVKSRQKSWNYLCLKIGNLNGSSRWEIQFLDQDNNLLYTREKEIKNGDNFLQLEEEDIYAINVIVKSPASFSIKKIQFRERLQNFTWNQAPGVFLIVCFCYFLIILLFSCLAKHHKSKRYLVRKKETWIEALQMFYARSMGSAGQLFRDVPQEGRSGLRKLLFIVSLLILYFTLLRNLNGKLLIQRRQTTFLAICMILIALLSWEQTKQKINWKNPLVYSWTILWLMSIVSEFVTEKRVQGVGVFMLVAMAPFYLAWNSMKRPERLTRDFLTALRWFYWAGSLFCIFFRGIEPTIRYVGIYTNPNYFAGYLVTANIAFLVSLDENLSGERTKNFVLAESVLGLVTIWGFLQMTQSVTSLVAYIMEWIVFLWRQFSVEKKRIYWRNLKKVLALSLVCIVVVGISGRWCLSNVPKIVEMEFEGDESQPVTRRDVFSFTAEASDQQAYIDESGLSNRLLGKVTSGEWDSLFSGRNEIWRNYIREWNLFGHYSNVECLSGQKMHAHSSLLQMMNDYGVFIAVPYLVMLYYSLKYSILSIFKKRERMNLFFPLVVVNFVVQGLAENIVTPYLCISWLTYYIALGGLFSQPEEAEL